MDTHTHVAEDGTHTQTVTHHLQENPPDNHVPTSIGRHEPDKGDQDMPAPRKHNPPRCKRIPNMNPQSLLLLYRDSGTIKNSLNTIGSQSDACMHACDMAFLHFSIVGYQADSDSDLREFRETRDSWKEVDWNWNW